ncbi:hypothetical protein B0T11DRAFT_92691 [Plectosphaerella cucumerina]|uniref:Uncharacterized protein n=1 Tax=Plectosphaerella cucumerina TaxID=40658 RepID=A0A8K0X5B9_9PEZI|nr:hypothetical protein B0T11DRAFT_92691 [Plectosphaerella cucumerina]
MCGHDTSNRPRGGALAVLSPSRSASPTTDDCPTVPDGMLLRGDLAFHTPGDPNSSTATHARWTGSGGSALEGLVVVIHRSGDMTRRSEECGLFHQFALAKAAAVPTAEDAFELALDEPVSLEVGEGGIIGRRVSIFSSSSFQRPPSTGEAAVAEGIVGFNFMQPVAASL